MTRRTAKVSKSVSKSGGECSSCDWLPRRRAWSNLDNDLHYLGAGRGQRRCSIPESRSADGALPKAPADVTAKVLEVLTS